MEEKRINEIQRKVNILLREKRLKPALERLGEEIDSLNSWELRTRYSEVTTAYNYMLEYMCKGMPDPNRALMHSELIGKAYLLNDEIAISRLAEHSISVYCQMRRKYKGEAAISDYHHRLREHSINMAMMQLMPGNEEKIKEVAKRHEQESGELFMQLWSEGSWSKKQRSEAQEMLSDLEVDNNDKAMFVSAITISLFKIFDPLKAIFLCDAATHEEVAISQRALVGLFITTFINNHRIEYYPELKRRIEQLCETPDFENRLLIMQLQLLRTRETQKIDRKMREEIIPAMLKNPNIRNAKLGLDLEKELEQDDKNPEWQAWIDDDGIKNKLDEMAQWQTEGADVYMSTFSQLKHYPFFNEMPNWFRPFDINNSAVAGIIPSSADTNKINVLKTLFASKFFCNSDKYSFCFTLQQVPEEQRSMLMGQLGEQHGEDIADPDTEQPSIPRKVEEELQSNQYIQDLYRFFKLSSFRNEFTDPFTLSLNLLESESPGNLLRTPQSMLRIFRYLLQKEYYTEASEIGSSIEHLKEENVCDAQFYQEMGYCKQKAAEYDAALKYYNKADIVKPDTLWTVRHIAQCHRLKRDPKSALPYYLQAEQLAPDNRAILMQTGECLVALKRFDEAFNRFFKVEYLEPDSIRSWRAIAWCSFMVEKYEQAAEYYSRLHASPKRNMQDWLNAGHVELVRGNNNPAIEFYQKAAALCKDGDEFSSNLFGDKKVLLAKGVSFNDLILIRDIVG
ncbi:MAG: hypothetical protein IKC70_04640 [Bacteroidaceae bacterium]|nr:hypothetical protein [Bacteroidaceae bacterium]